MSKEELLSRYEMGETDLFEEVKTLYEEALKETPQDPDILHSYGFILEKQGRQYLQEAAQQYEKAIQANPDWPQGHYQWIYISSALGQTYRAIQRYKDLIEQNPENVMNYTYLSMAYLQVDQLPEAEKVMEAGLKVDPNNAYLMHFAGEVYKRLGQPHKALESWSRSLELDPEIQANRYSRAFLLEQLGELEEAMAEWRMIIAWMETRGLTVDVEDPKRELARLQKQG